MYTQKGNCAAAGPNFYIHGSVSDLYIPQISHLGSGHHSELFVAFLHVFSLIYLSLKRIKYSYLELFDAFLHVFSSIYLSLKRIKYSYA